MAEVYLGVVLAGSTLKVRMGKRTSRRSNPRLINKDEDGVSRCPYCGTTQDERSTLSILENLVQSQAELCLVLRLAGRQLLPFAKQDDQTLERIRKALKRAENIRKTVGSPEEPQRDADELSAATETPASGYIPDLPLDDAPIRKSAQKKSRLTRPYSLAVLKFPTG